MITRKNLIEQLESMNSTAILFPAWKRTANHRGYAVEQALGQFISTAFGQQTHSTITGTLKQNPKWFKQLYTDLEWSPLDITPRTILSTLK